MRLDNIGAAAVDLTFPNSCEMLPSFTTAAGQPVTPANGGFACLTVITRTQVPPGASIQRTIVVQTAAATDGSTAVLPSGAYRIAARLMDDRFKLQSDSLPFSLR
jgi:hypothetical protein